MVNEIDIYVKSELFLKELVDVKATKFSIPRQDRVLILNNPRYPEDEFMNYPGDKGTIYEFMCPVWVSMKKIEDLHHLWINDPNSISDSIADLFQNKSLKQIQKLFEEQAIATAIFDSRLFYQVPTACLILDSKLIRETLTARFVWGQEARSFYYGGMYTLCQLIQQEKFSKFQQLIKEIFGNCCEHRILRAGEVMGFNHFINKLRSQADDFKRSYVSEDATYDGTPTATIKWGESPLWRIKSEICSASGATFEAITIVSLNQIKKGLFFNMTCGTINSINRSLPLIIAAEKQAFYSFWGGISAVWRKNLNLIHETIKSGTIININPDNEIPHNTAIYPQDVYEFLKDSYKNYPEERLGYFDWKINSHFPKYPDMAGEVGEKIQSARIPVLRYDLLEFFMTWTDVTRKPWKELVKRAWRMQGVQEAIKQVSPTIFEFYKSKIENDAPIISIPTKVQFSPTTTLTY